MSLIKFFFSPVTVNGFSAPFFSNPAQEPSNQSALLGLKFFPISKSFSKLSDQVANKSLTSFSVITFCSINLSA